MDMVLGKTDTRTWYLFVLDRIQEHGFLCYRVGMLKGQGGLEVAREDQDALI